MGKRGVPAAARRFPAPWSVEDTGIDRAFAVKEASGQKLAHVYYEVRTGLAVGSKNAHQTWSRRIAANFTTKTD
jgi:hypothetical protein